MNRVCMILAAGKGTRAGGGVPKQFQRLNGKMLLQHTIDACDKIPGLTSVYVVLPAELPADTDTIKSSHHMRVAVGGDTRIKSIMNGWREMVADGCDGDTTVIVHNAAQPFLSVEDVSIGMKLIEDGGDVALGIVRSQYSPYIGADGFVKSAIPRGELLLELGPEYYRMSMLSKASSFLRDSGVCQFEKIPEMVIAAGLADVLYYEGCHDNFKITYPVDFDDAETKIKEIKQ